MPDSVITMKKKVKEIWMTISQKVDILRFFDNSAYEREKTP